MARKSKKKPLPSKDDILAFINESSINVSKREIARAFHIKGEERIWLKGILKEMAEEGLLAQKGRRQVLIKDKLPPVMVCTLTSEFSPDGEPLLEPTNDEFSPAPKIILDDSRAAKLAPGEQLLVRLRKEDDFYIAKMMKRLDGKAQEMVGVVHITKGAPHLAPCTRQEGRKYPIKNLPPDIEAGDLVLASISSSSHHGKRIAKIKQRLGEQGAPDTLSTLSIHSLQIPHIFPTEALQQARKELTVPPLGQREDLRHLPLVTIDGEDAKDFDDAVWAEHTEDEGWHLIVAIADVAHYVHPNTPLDKEAYLRGNSVYLPDQVIPMLPEELSNDLCSLRPNKDRASFAVHLWLDQQGRLKKHKFVRALIKSHARLTYNQVKEALDGNPDKITAPLMDEIIHPLFGAFEELKKARQSRGTLDFDIPEQRIVFADDGNVAEVVPLIRNEAHMLIEEFMILANVAAAQQLEQRNAPCMYRIHEPPSEEKIAALRETLKGLGLKLPKGQVVLPKTFSQLIEASKETPHHSLVSELALRSQMQARYDPSNAGHFGLNLTRYAHFTSPIRRYADLVVHRSLISSLDLGKDGLSGHEIFEEMAKHISTTDRRAEQAERDVKARFISAYLQTHIGKEFLGRIRGVVNFGLFVELNGLGMDGLVPMSLLPNDYWVFEESKHQLIGRRTRHTYTLGDPITVRLVDVNPLANSVTLEVSEGPKTKSMKKKPKKPQIR